MATGINISIASETRQFATGVQRGVIEPLEGAAEALDDLAKEAQQSGEGIERGLEQGADGARQEVESATEKMERSFKDLATTSKRESRKIGDDLGDEVKKGARKAETAVDSFKDEAKQNFSETASSFDGSMSSAVDGIQGTLGGLATTLGPAGAIGAGLAAAGLGTAVTFATQWAEQQAEIAQGFRDMYAEAAEEGRNFLSASQVVAEANRIQFGEDQARVDRIRADAAKIGIDFQTMLLAHAGDADSLAVALEAADRKYQEMVDNAKRSAPDLNTGMDQGVVAALGLRGELEGIKDQHDKNTVAATVAGRIAEEMAEKARAAAIKATGGFLKEGETLDGLAGKLRGMPDANVKVNVDTPNVRNIFDTMQTGLNGLGPLKVGVVPIGPLLQGPGRFNAP